MSCIVTLTVKHFRPCLRSALLEFLGAVRTVDVLVMTYKALVSQGQGALLTSEAVLVPRVPFIIHHVGALSKSCYRVVTAGTLLGYKRLVAIHTIVVILDSSEALAGQLFVASFAHKAVAVPWLILIGYPSR